VSGILSRISCIKAVGEKLIKMQREFGIKGACNGWRDIEPWYSLKQE
jgi:hypothetical protein